MRRAILVSAAILLAGGCSFDSSGPAESDKRPQITSASIAINPRNALSALVTFHSRNADSARLIYRAVVPALEAEHTSPYYPVRDNAGVIAALGLRDNYDYDVILQLRSGNADTSTKMSFRAGPVPVALAGLQLTSSGAHTPGFTLTDFTSAGSAWIVAFDQTGALCWYREFAAGPGEVAIDAEQQANGNYILFVGVSTGWQPTPGRFYEVNPRGDSVRTYAASDPYYTDPHELLIEYDQTGVARFHILGYEFRHVDLTSIGGKADQLVAGHLILRQSPSGSIEFRWNAWDHFSIADWIFIQPGLAQMPSIDFDHPNSLAKDSDGNYVVSFASLGEITKIDATTGQILWRFGGRNNQFTFVGDPLDGFGIQHHVRVLPNGNLMLIDNGVRHTPPESRAVEYKLDLAAHTATMVWQYRPSPRLFAPFAGSAQRLRNGNTFVAFGAAAQVAEVTSTG